MMNICTSNNHIVKKQHYISESSCMYIVLLKDDNEKDNVSKDERPFTTSFISQLLVKGMAYTNTRFPPYK